MKKRVTNALSQL